MGGALGSAAGGRRRGRSASERGGRVDKSNPGCSWRGSGNSRTFGRLTCHAAGLLGDGALGHRVEAAGQRAEARRIPDMVWLRRIVPASVTRGGRSTRVQEDSRTQEFRVQSLDCSTPLRLSRCQIIAGDRINPHGKIPLSRCGRQSCWSRLSSTHPAIRSDLD